MDGLVFALPFNNGHHPYRAVNKSVAFVRGGGAFSHGLELATDHIALGAVCAVDVFFHEDALAVVAVGVFQRVVAFADGLHLVEAGVGEGVLAEDVCVGFGKVDGMGLCGLVVDGIGKDQQIVHHLSGHAPVGVIVHPTRPRIVEPNPSQAVEVVVCETFFQVALVVGSRG